MTLPVGWTTQRLDRCCEVILGQSPPGETYNEDGHGLPFFQGKGEFDDLHPVAEKWCSAPRKIAQPGDVLVSVRAPVGPTNLADMPCCIGRGLAALRPTANVRSRWVLYGMRLTERGLASRATGTTFQAVSGSVLRSHILPVPSLHEQDLIIAEIEKHFTRLDAAVAGLEGVKAKLRAYRTALLHAATTGTLLPPGRRIGRQGTELLDGILANRRMRWAASQFESAKRAGREPNISRITARYRPPLDPDNAPAAPAGWVAVTLDQLAWSVKDGPHFSPPYVTAGGVPFITGGNVRPEGVDFSATKQISHALHSELSKRCVPEVGDVLYTKGGTTGIARVNTYDFEFNVWVHVAVLKLVEGVDPFYLQHALNAPQCRAQARRFTHGVGNQDLGLTRMVRIVLLLPPLDEQRRIAIEVERRLTLMADIERQVESALRRAQHLRGAILTAAFSGTLVPATHSGLAMALHG